MKSAQSTVKEHWTDAYYAARDEQDATGRTPENDKARARAQKVLTGYFSITAAEMNARHEDRKAEKEKKAKKLNPTKETP